jgi:DNA-binding SARP family transcriptional activator/tetratricopeptide (TPR) repeat protein/GTPase SAR1 family protein
MKRTPDALAGFWGLPELIVKKQDSVRIQLLGPFRLLAHGRAVAIPSSRARTILAYLALRAGTSSSREDVAASVWPECDQTTSSARLRQALWHLRRALNPLRQVLSLDTASNMLFVSCSLEIVDALRFRDLVVAHFEEEAQLREALALYEGDLLQDMTGEWVEHERYHFRALFLRAVKQLISLLLSRGAATEALPFAHRAVTLDTLDEEATYLLMEAAAKAGKPAIALAQYDTLARGLITELGVTPGQQVAALYQRIRANLPAFTEDRIDTMPVRVSADPEPLYGLTGRVSERSRLLNALDRTRRGYSAAFVLTGPAGVGKTRLAEAIVAEARARGLLVCKGRCSETKNPPPYHSIVEALWPQIVSIPAPLQSPALGPLLSRIRARSKGRRARASVSVQNFDAALITESLLRLLSSPGQAPLLLFIDDVHRADHATSTWLSILLARLSELQVCVILTARTGETEDQEQLVAQLAAGGAEVLALQPLDQLEMRALISSVLGTSNLPRVLSTAIRRYVGGNPLQILEAIRLLKDRRLLQLSDAGWITDPEAPEVLATFASAHVRALVDQRIALLPEATRNVLAGAAILGMDINPTHLRSLVATPARQVLRHVDRLIRLRLLMSSPEAMLHFPHEEIRNTVLDQISAVHRQWLHASAAHILSRDASTRPEDLYWHYEGGGDPGGALAAAIAAGDGALVVGEHESSVMWYDRALAIFANSRLIADSVRQLAIELKLESALDGHGDRPRQLHVLESVIAAATRAGHNAEACEALIRRSLCLTRMNQRDAALEAARQATDLAHRQSDLIREARAYRAMGLAYENFDDAQNILFLGKALRLFRQLGTKAEESTTLSELATAYDRLGNHTAALRALDRAATLVTADDRSRALLVARRAAAYLWTGRLSETYTAIQESLALHRHSGDRIGEARTLRILADAHGVAGRYREALSTAGRALKIARQANDTRLVSSILNSLIASVYSRLGLVQRANAAFSRLLTLLGTDSHVWYRALYEDSLSIAYLHAGLWEEARLWAERALATASMLDREWYASTEARLHLAHALLELREPASAKRHLLISLRYHRSTGDLPYQVFEAALLAVAAIDLGDTVEGDRFLRDSIRLLHRVDVLQDAHVLHWLHGHVWSRLGAQRQAARAFRAAYAELNRVAAPLGAPLRRRFLALPFQRRILEAVGMEPVRMFPQTNVSSAAGPLSPDPSGIRSASVRRQAVLQALSDPTGRPNRRTLAAAFGVTPRTITNDIAALRRAGHQIVTPKTVH